MKKTLVFKNGLSFIGLLSNCLNYALTDKRAIGGVFEFVKSEYQSDKYRDLLETVSRINEFCDTKIVQRKEELTDRAIAKRELMAWIEGLWRITGSD